MSTRSMPAWNTTGHYNWNLASVANHLILIAGTLFLILPVLMIFLSSTHSTGTLLVDGLQLSWGERFLDNYFQVLTLKAGFFDKVTALGMLANSLLVGFGVALLSCALSLLAAYALVFFRLPAATLIFWVIIATLLLPLESRFIPTYAVVADLGLTNTRIGMILPVLALALGTFFFRQFFLTLPDELMEAATLDGAGPSRFLIDILLPLSFARAGAIFTITFMLGWNQYLWPLMISTDESLYTLMRGVRMVGQVSGPGMALLMISILPPLLMVGIFQRWFFSALVEMPNRN